MGKLHIEATERSPEIDFDLETNVFSIRGESYPEDVAEFFGPVIKKLNGHLEALEHADVTFNLELVYFNSTSAKIFMSLFETLDSTAANGNRVVINWYYEEEDDNMEELGQEFGEDLEQAKFNMVPKG
ncbi:MAG: DUF1987 domain-containing protein [Deltaproteobacteria bacterium]|nr:DUF1987 domain-containing protein [Deltaproteobacteria bacterium]